MSWHDYDDNGDGHLDKSEEYRMNVEMGLYDGEDLNGINHPDSDGMYTDDYESIGGASFSGYSSSNSSKKKQQNNYEAGPVGKVLIYTIIGIAIAGSAIMALLMIGSIFVGCVAA